MKYFYFFLFFFAALGSNAQTEATITEIQGETDVSPFENQEVITTGIVYAPFPDDDFFYIQDGYGVWKGIYVESDFNASVGDEVEVTGTVVETDSMTTLVATNVELLNVLMATSVPQSILTGLYLWGEAEENEGGKVKVDWAFIDQPELLEGDIWRINDGTLPIYVWGLEDGFVPTLGANVSVTGCLHQVDGDWRIRLIEMDVIVSVDEIEEEPEIQVRNLNTTWNIETNFQFDRVQLVGSNGKSIIDRSITPTEIFNLDHSQLSAGVYIVRLYSEGKIHTHKVIN